MEAWQPPRLSGICRGLATRFPDLATKPENHSCRARVGVNKIACYIKSHATHENENHYATRSRRPRATGENKTTAEFVSVVLQKTIPHAGMPGEIRSGSRLVDSGPMARTQGRPVNISPYNQNDAFRP